MRYLLKKWIHLYEFNWQHGLVLLFVGSIFFASFLFGDIPRLPGTDEMDKLTAAGTLLRLVDSFIFKFGARILAGLSILAAGWNLKEQRFAMAIVSILAAIVLGTVPMWIKNIFEMGGGTLFS